LPVSRVTAVVDANRKVVVRWYLAIVWNVIKGCGNMIRGSIYYSVWPHSVINVNGESSLRQSNVNSFESENFHLLMC